MEPENRRTGIVPLGDVPWGSHICMFYQTLEDSLAILEPYFKNGLENDEYCFWVVPDSESIAACKRRLSNSVPDLDARMKSGQIEIVTPDQWYLRDGEFDSKAVLDGWVLKLNGALKMGFAGMRLAGDTSWLTSNDWDRFADYENKVGNLFDNARVIAICCYKQDCCDASGVIDVVSVHQLSLIKRGTAWKLIENAEHRRAVEAVQAMEKSYERIMENIPVAVYSALPDELWTTIKVTERIKDLTGYSANELVERPELFSEIIHKDDREAVWKQLEEHRRKKDRLRLEYRIVTKDGQIRWVKDEAVPVLGDNGAVVRIDGFTEDITDLKEVEDALRHSEERYALAERAAKIGSWDWDIASGKLVWSEEIEPMFGFTKGRFEGTYEAFLQTVHPDDRKTVEDGVRTCVEKGDRYEVEHRIVWPDGSVHWMAEFGDVIRDGSGKAIRMVGMVRDVTRQKLNEERIQLLNRQLETRTSELESSNKELEAFCYSVSHDLRAPLRRIDGFSQILLEDHGPALQGDARASIERIRVSTKIMDRLIDDLLRLSRITTAEVSKEEVDLTRIAHKVADRLKKTDSSRNVRFSIKKTAPATGDKDLLEIAMQNLLENAWKFTGKQDSAAIEFGMEEENGHQVYYVKDNGIGFDMNSSSKLFQPFQRLHGRDDFPGTGIGLAIVSRIIARHQGSIWAESQEGKGAKFKFTLNQRFLDNLDSVLQ